MFDLLGDWEERYRHAIDLGRDLEPPPDAERTPANKVSGCASQVWLSLHRQTDGSLHWIGDSDAHIVRGLIAILLALYSGHTAREIGAIDPAAVFGRIGLKDHLTPQRSNGLRSMVERIRLDAAHALTAA